MITFFRAIVSDCNIIKSVEGNYEAASVIVMERGSSSGPCKSSSVSLRNLVAWVFEIYIALNVDDLVEDILAFYDAKCVLRILVSDTPTTDQLIWHFNPDGRYSVRFVQMRRVFHYLPYVADVAPPEGCLLKCNVDSACFEQEGAISPSIVEAFTIKEVLSWLKSLAFDNDIVESDSVIVILALSHPSSDFSEL
ncbi:hypothetical protein Gorai_012814, partial [Gossypium raimondii]|nr:hypothetical protein [Gossypium raimondii]